MCGSTLAVVLLLCLDTATPVLSVGVVRLSDAKVRAEVLAERVEPVGHGHGERLAPAAAEVLAAAGVVLRDLDALVVGLGPGPFTGLRIGIVSAAALGDAAGIPTYGVCSLDALARSGPAVPALVATDARRREIYWATYERSGRRLTGPAVDRPAAVAPLLADAEITAGAGAGAVAYADVLGLIAAADLAPTPAGLALAAHADGVLGQPPAPLTPLYLRRPDAAEPHRPKQVTPA